MSNNGYNSPLMDKLRNNEKLSLNVLAREVPIVKAGKAANVTLEEEIAVLTSSDKRALNRTILLGEQATEKLVIIALPLIQSLASKEHARRKNWRSRIPLDDIVAEGISGFLRGINAYNPEGNHKSPTNYLGQWITMEIRRNLEVMEHDFHIPYEAMERYRKIRAVRTRVAHELGREATDDEMLEACNGDGQFGDAFLGRVIKKPSEEGKRRRMITQKHLDDERAMFDRTGAFFSTTVSSDEGEYNNADTAAAQSVTVDTGDNTHTPEHHANNRSDRALNGLIENSFSIFGIGVIQRDIIRRRYGITPYDEAEKIKDIAISTSIPKHKVTRLLALFAKEMSASQGAFHYLLSQMTEDDAYSYGLSSLQTTFGDYPTGLKPSAPHKDLTADMQAAVADLDTGTQRYASTHEHATYFCPFGGPEVERFYEPGEVPRSTIPCPHCQRVIPRKN